MIVINHSSFLQWEVLTLQGQSMKATKQQLRLHPISNQEIRQGLYLPSTILLECLSVSRCLSISSTLSSNGLFLGQRSWDWAIVWALLRCSLWLQCDFELASVPGCGFTILQRGCILRWWSSIHTPCRKHQIHIASSGYWRAKLPIAHQGSCPQHHNREGVPHWGTWGYYKNGLWATKDTTDQDDGTLDHIIMRCKAHWCIISNKLQACESRVASISTSVSIQLF